MGDVLTRVCLVFEEGPGIGLGHRRRVQVLERALVARGAETRALSVDEARHVMPECDVIVVDSYNVGPDELASPGTFRVAIDDLDRGNPADLVVDPNPVGLPSHTRRLDILRGVEFALIDNLASGVVPRPVGGHVERVLVTVGGADSHGLAAEIAGCIADTSLSVRVVMTLGPWSTDRVPDDVGVVRTTEGLISELASVDVVVTAGGVTALEALSVGRPAVVFAVAPNQERSVAGMSDADAAVCLPVGVGVSKIAAATADVVGLSKDERLALSVRGRQYVDGRGADRVAEVILERC